MNEIIEGAILLSSIPLLLAATYFIEIHYSSNSGRGEEE